MSSFVGLGVSPLLDVEEAVALLGRVAEPARELGGENVVWVALWVCVAALGVLVSGVWVESDWWRDAAVIMSSAVWAITPLGCSASREPDEFGVPPGVCASVAVGAVAVGDGGGPVAGVGLAASTVVPATPRVNGGVGVDPAPPAAELGPPEEDVVAGEVPGSGFAEEASGFAGCAPAGEEVRADGAPAPAGDAMADIDVSAPTGGDAGSEEGSAPAGGEAGSEEGSALAGGEAGSEEGSALAGGEAGSEEGSAPAGGVELGAPAEAGACAGDGVAAAAAVGVDVSVAVGGAASAVVSVISVATATAAGLPARVVAAAAAVSGVEAPDSGAGGVTIPPPPPPPAAPAPLVPARLSLARGTCEGRGA